MPLPPELAELAEKVRNWGRWGDDDECGTANLIDAEAVRRGTVAVRRGDVVSLTMPLGPGSPQEGGAPGRFNPVRRMISVNMSYTGDANEVDAHAELCCDTHSARRAYAATRYLLRRARDLCATHGAELTVMGVPDPWDFDTAALRTYAPQPSSFDPDRPTRELRSFCEELGLRFIDLREHLTRRHYKTADNHWNEAGHRRVAEVIGSLLHGVMHGRGDAA